MLELLVSPTGVGLPSASVAHHSLTGERIDWIYRSQPSEQITAKFKMFAVRLRYLKVSSRSDLGQQSFAHAFLAGA
jgi:hypothetical protein